MRYTENNSLIVVTVIYTCEYRGTVLMSWQMYAVSVRNGHVWHFNQITDITSVEGLLVLFHRVEKVQTKQRRGSGNGESVHVTRCSWWRALTSVIIFPLVLFLSRWLALFCFCCSTRSLVVRYSRANSLRILLKRWMLTSRTAYIGWPRNSRNAWNLQMCGETSHHCTESRWRWK